MCVQALNSLVENEQRIFVAFVRTLLPHPPPPADPFYSGIKNSSASGANRTKKLALMQHYESQE